MLTRTARLLARTQNMKGMTDDVLGTLTGAQRLAPT